ncbi:DinB family protein [Nocardia ninae]|uniref:DinB-like domain-containing protein n=1 Tax=Nocardia ninae NBRC 108245 TaxID=1210091 RepID=A0A511M8M2_9NOCA|nr:DinB family protein [Nocardia ninae]GEM36468.1 hypothetical protein NN4_09870 [Nocardia ninae NBRC 108245]
MAEIDRSPIHAELERVRADLHRLLDSAMPADFDRVSDGTRWTNEQLLFHMVFGYMVVQRLLILMRLFDRLPPRISRGYARLLDAGTRPFHWVNYHGSCAAGRVYNRGRMGAKLDRVIASLHRRLDSASERDMARGMYFPTRWDPFFTEYMTLTDLFHYPAQHYDFHRNQLTITGRTGRQP